MVAGTEPLCAQTAQLIEPVSPDDYNQSRNVSVLERPRPDYDPVGVVLGSFLLYPRLDLSVAGSDNVYVTPDDRQAAVYGRVAPSMDLRSDWERHRFDLSAQSVFLHYVGERPLDRNTWDIRSSGRLDVGDFGSLAIEAQISKLQEDPFTSQTNASLAVLSSYRRNFVAVRAQREVGRTRLLASFTATHLRFSKVDVTDGEALSQKSRDRAIMTGAGQAEYALSPGAVLLARVAYTGTRYDQAMIAEAVPNRNANSVDVVGGLNLDLAGFIRGTMQAGYVRRDYTAVAYRSVAGASGEIKLEYFLSDIMNFNVDARRVLDDSATSDNAPYFENSISVGADRDVRHNVVLSVNGGIGSQNYVGSSIRYNFIRINTSVKYLASRHLSFRVDAGFGRRKQLVAGPPSKIDQSTIMMTVDVRQ